MLPTAILKLSLERKVNDFGTLPSTVYLVRPLARALRKFRILQLKKLR